MRLLSIIVLIGLLTMLMAAPVAAKPQNTGCGATASGWEAVTYQEWLDRTEEADPANAPLSPELEAEILAGLAAIDKNGDGWVCWKLFVPSVKGAWPPGFFLIGDNVSAAGDQKEPVH